MGQLVEIAREAHPPGSPEHDRVRGLLVEELRDLGLDPVVETATSMRRRDGTVVAATVRNVLARIPGTGSTGTLLLTAHYDGRGISRAAADDGFGVVAILETARALLEGPQPRNDVLLLLTDAEELGLLGARAFVAGSPSFQDVQVALSLEMRGGGGAVFMFETGAENGWIVRQLARHGEAPFASSMGYEVYRRLPNDTDFTPLKEAGVQGLNFAGIGRAPVYHQAWDAPQHVSEATLQHHGVQLLSLTRPLAQADLSAVDAPDVAFFTVPFLGLVVYPPEVGWGIAVGLVILFVLVLLLVRRRGAAWGSVGAGAALALLVAAASWGVGLWLPGWLAGFHPERGALQGSAFYGEGWYVLALAAVVLTVTLALLGPARRRFSLGGLALGVGAILVVASVAAAVVAPRAAMHVQWPAAALLLAAAASSGVGARGRPGWSAWVVALLAALPVLVLMVFLAEAVWLALSIAQAPLLGLALALTVLPLLPALDTLREPNAWWAPVLGAVSAAALVGAGLLLRGPAPDRPLPTTLSWALDRETGEARWLTQPVSGDDGEEDPARAWAVERAGASFAGTWSLPGREGVAWPAAPAPTVGAAEPQLAVVGDAVDPAGRREVVLALRSGVGAEMMALEMPDEATVTSVGGRPVPDGEAGAGPVRRVVHWGRPQEAVRVGVRVPADVATLPLTVVEHLLRPEELLGDEPWRRPADMAPNVNMDSDRAILRTPLRVALTGGRSPSAPGDEGSGAAPADTLPGSGVPDTVPDLAPDTGGGAGAPVDPDALPDTASGPGG
jgi:hypothetical protein